MTEDNRKDYGGNGWTQYQRLVLDTLTRHDRKLEEVSEQLVDQQISFASLKKDLENNTSVVKELITKLEDTKKTQADHKLDLKALQWKFGAVVTVVSTVVGYVFQAVLKLILHT